MLAALTLSFALASGLPEDDANLRKIQREINAAAGRQVMVVTTGRAHVWVMGVEKIPPRGKMTIAGTFTGVAKQSGTIRIVKRLKGQKRYNVLLHEVLHAYGMDHSEDPRSVMFWKQGKPKTQSMTAADVSRLKVLLR